MVLAVINLILEEKPTDPSKLSFRSFADLHKKVQTIDSSLLATIELNCLCTITTSPPKKLRFSWADSSTKIEFSPFLYK